MANGLQIFGRTTLLPNKDVITVAADADLDLNNYLDPAHNTGREITLKFTANAVVTIQNGTVENPRTGDSNTQITAKLGETFDVVIFNHFLTIKLPEVEAPAALTNVDGGTFI